MIIFIIMLILLELIAIFLQELYFFSLRVNASLTGQIFVKSPFKGVFFFTSNDRLSQILVISYHDPPPPGLGVKTVKTG